MRTPLLCAVALSAFGFCAPANAGLPPFQPLPLIPGSSAFSRAWHISDDGTTVVGQVMDGTVLRGATWRTGELEIVFSPTPSGFVTFSLGGVSATGGTTVGSANTAQFHPVSIDGSGIHDLVVGDAVACAASAISSDGSTVVGWAHRPSGPTIGYRLHNGTTDWITGNSPFIEARDTSADGSVVVGAADARAFRWSEQGGLVFLPNVPNLTTTAATAVSNDGNSIVGYASSAGSGLTGWVWRNNQYSILSMTPGATGCTAFDISGDGRIIVGYEFTPLGREACYWDEAGTPHLLAAQLLQQFGVSLAGWREMFPYGVSANGLTIAGFGNNPSGITQSWVITLPSSGAACTMIACATPLVRRRRPTTC